MAGLDVRVQPLEMGAEARRVCAVRFEIPRCLAEAVVLFLQLRVFRFQRRVLGVERFIGHVVSFLSRSNGSRTIPHRHERSP